MNTQRMKSILFFLSSMPFLVVVVAASNRLGGSQQNTTLINLETLNFNETTTTGRRLNRPLRKVSSNGKNLGKCQGDCNSDNDCTGNLVCYQRSTGSTGGVPGCAGNGPNDGTDYCMDPDDGDQPVVVTDPGTSSGGGGSTGSGSSSSGSGFKLKLYWENGYFWQESTREIQWCAECADCGNTVIFDNSGWKCQRSTCSAGKQLQLELCSKGGERFNSVGSMIQTSSGSKVCLTRKNGSYISLENCDRNNKDQQWSSLTSSKFEINPKSDSSKCITQYHHPKKGEPIGVMPCTNARSADTSYWVKF